MIYPNINDTIPTNIRFTFFLMNDWTNQYCSVSFGYICDTYHNSVSFGSEMNSYEQITELDLSHVNLHLALDSISNGYPTEIEKESQIESMKQGKINRGGKRTFKIYFCNDDSNNRIEVLLRKLLLEYVMLY
jgi:hypothetical protein